MNLIKKARSFVGCLSLVIVIAELAAIAAAYRKVKQAEQRKEKETCRTENADS